MLSICILLQCTALAVYDLVPRHSIHYLFCLKFQEGTTLVAVVYCCLLKI